MKTPVHAATRRVDHIKQVRSCSCSTHVPACDLCCVCVCYALQHFTQAASEELPFDPVDVRARYEHERDIRLARRPEGAGQYTHIKDLAEGDERFAKMLSDPWSEVPEREPLLDTVEVAIIGGGYGGLCAGARLVQEGVPSGDIRLVDSASAVGGTWYWNR